MEPITVAETLAPVVSRPEAAASARVLASFGNEVDQLLVAAVSDPALGTKVDLKA